MTDADWGIADATTSSACWCTPRPGTRTARPATALGGEDLLFILNGGVALARLHAAGDARRRALARAAQHLAHRRTRAAWRDDVRARARARPAALRRRLTGDLHRRCAPPITTRRARRGRQPLLRPAPAPHDARAVAAGAVLADRGAAHRPRRHGLRRAPRRRAAGGARRRDGAAVEHLLGVQLPRHRHADRGRARARRAPARRGVGRDRDRAADGARRRRDARAGRMAVPRGARRGDGRARRDARRGRDLSRRSASSPRRRSW